LTRIYLIRHAEAEGNVFRRAHGQSDGLVTNIGYGQIEKLKERFIDVHIDKVYSSDLTRAMETSAAITEPHGLALETTPMLREVDMGVWELMAWGDIAVDYPEMSAYFSTDPAHWVVEGAESYDGVVSRMVEFITQVAQRHDGETIALFSHGFAIRVFFCRIMGVASHEWHSIPYCDNTAVALLLYEDGKFSIEYQSDNSHLRRGEEAIVRQRTYFAENLRYMKLDTERDAGLLGAFSSEFGALPSADIGYAAYIADEPVGLVGVDVKGDCCEVKYMFLKPERRRHNFGVQLLGTAATAAREAERDILRITSPQGSGVSEFCLRHGFHIVSESGGGVVLEKSIRS